MRFIILGMGAVGSLWAYQLYNHGHSVYGLCRGKHYRKIKSDGLKIKDINGKDNIVEIGANFDVFSGHKEAGPFFEQLTAQDCIMITSKAYSLNQIAEQYSNQILRHGSVLLLQNGIGNEEIVKEYCPESDIYRATTTYGALLEAPGSVASTGRGFTKIGFPKINRSYGSKIDEEKTDKIKKIANVFSKADLKTEYTDDIDLVLWEKIFVNIGINALGTIHNICNGQLIEDDSIREMMKTAIAEAWNVAKSKNIDVKPSADPYINLTFNVARKTAANRNSMLQDISNGKPTEIDFINGKIIGYAEEEGVEVLVNKALTEKIKDLEKA